MKFAGGVTFDEGGVRLRRFGRARYVPFDRIADARVATDIFARPFLVIEEGRAAVSEVLRGAPPPLVVAMACELAAPETVREALAFLTTEDRREVSTAPARARARVRVADDARLRVGADEDAVEEESPAARKGRAA